MLPRAEWTLSFTLFEIEMILVGQTRVRNLIRCLREGKPALDVMCF